MERSNLKAKKKETTKDQSFLSLSMGMIQPEWLFMSHFFDDLNQEHSPKRSSPKKTNSPQPSSAIRIYFHARK